VKTILKITDVLEIITVFDIEEYQLRIVYIIRFLNHK